MLRKMQITNDSQLNESVCADHIVVVIQIVMCRNIVNDQRIVLCSGGTLLCFIIALLGKYMSTPLRKFPHIYSCTNAKQISQFSIQIDSGGNFQVANRILSEREKRTHTHTRETIVEISRELIRVICEKRKTKVARFFVRSVFQK